LLHGFPEFWYGWRKQIEPLAEAGFRVIVPDQRGYNLSGKPAGVRDYRMRELSGDVIAIADQIGRERILLAGHDWGAAVAWDAAMRFPARIGKLGILNVPHPAVMMRFLRTNPRQMLRSWYMLFFQIPRLPELMISTRALVNTSRPGTFTPEDLDRYRGAWAQPGARRGMLNWYRALFRDMFRERPRHMPAPAMAQIRVSAPVRIIWGVKDRFLLPEMAAESLKYCDSGELFEIPEASHWVHHEEPERVNRLLIEFFKAI
jgi:pimeloyl-ACP methyl ester carboxylesterase